MAKILKAADAEFHSRFERVKLQQLLFESERIEEEFEKRFTLDKYIHSFLQQLDSRFETDLVNKMMQNAFPREADSLVVPFFLSAYFKLKVTDYLDELIKDFCSHFISTEEEKWISFIREQSKEMARKSLLSRE